MSCGAPEADTDPYVAPRPTSIEPGVVSAKCRLLPAVGVGVAVNWERTLTGVEAIADAEPDADRERDDESANPNTRPLLLTVRPVRMSCIATDATGDIADARFLVSTGADAAGARTDCWLWRTRLLFTWPTRASSLVFFSESA